MRTVDAKTGERVVALKPVDPTRRDRSAQFLDFESDSDPWSKPLSGKLIGVEGTTLAEVCLRLEPKWLRLWVELGAGYAMLAAGILASAVLTRSLGRSEIASGLAIFAANAAVCLVTACWTGFWLAYVELFFHEAAHFNLAPGRRLNDFLANILLGSLVAQNIQNYRKTHFDHHRHLGMPSDTERSYFAALNLRFFFESLFGISAIRILTRRNTHAGNRRSGFAYVIFGLGIHAALSGVLLFVGAPATAVAWCAGVASFFPFFTALRQLLEHRDPAADPRVDYTVVRHGPFNRLFGTGPLASTFGGAGFNRHMLHHLVPRVSCTRLAELEEFLMTTPLASELDERRTSYVATFLELTRSSYRARGGTR